MPTQISPCKPFTNILNLKLGGGGGGGGDGLVGVGRKGRRKKERAYEKGEKG